MIDSVCIKLNNVNPTPHEVPESIFWSAMYRRLCENYVFRDSDIESDYLAYDDEIY